LSQVGVLFLHNDGQVVAGNSFRMPRRCCVTAAAAVQTEWCCSSGDSAAVCWRQSISNVGQQMVGESEPMVQQQLMCQSDVGVVAVNWANV
jgi:hypothetical protein